MGECLLSTSSPWTCQQVRELGETFGVTCILDCSAFINGHACFHAHVCRQPKPFTTMGSDAGSYNGSPIFVIVSEYLK